VFDWHQAVELAFDVRPELRRQRWMIKQRELQLIASKNFLQPRLDMVGRHRFRGLGRDLTGGESFQAVLDNPNNNNNVSGAFADLYSGNFQEWQLGFEMRMPVGNRQGHTAVRNAELATQRERIVLYEQERKIMLDLSNAVAEVRRAASTMDLAKQRYDAVVEYRAQAAERIERGRAQFDVLLEAQRRVLESQVQFINAEVEYREVDPVVWTEIGCF
jgi:outer membrane protein TolC